LQDNFDLSGSSSFSTFFTSNGIPIVELPSGSGAPLELHTDFEAYSAEAQQIVQTHRVTWIVGSRYQTGESDIESLALSTRQDATLDLRRFSAYGYSFWQVADPFQLVAGVAYDNLHYPANASSPPTSQRELDKDQWSPKAGFYWTPGTDTTVHGMYARSLGGVYYDTSVRLEPTQIAGFNQAFRSIIPESVAGLIPGSEFNVFGVGIEQKFATKTYLTIAGQLLKSDADRTTGVFDLSVFPPPTVPTPPAAGSLKEQIDFEEKSVSVVLNQLLGKHWSVGAAYRLSNAELEEDFTSLPPLFQSFHNRDLRATLQQASLFAIFNHPSGFFAQANSIWSQQDNRGYDPHIHGEDFWQHNAFVGYRLLHRHVEARIGLLNITDQNYRLNPLTLYSELPRGRTLAASLRFYF
jgi:TonB-dependent receptor-like protein